MLEMVVAALAAALVIAGIAVIAGPALPRLLRSGWALARRSSAPGLPASRPPSDLTPALHPTSARALTAAARAYSLLRANGEDRLAVQLRTASRLVRADETRGLLALATVLRGMQGMTLADRTAESRYRQLVQELRDAVKDRSEQLELLHFG